MPHIGIKLDVDEHPFDALATFGDPALAAEEGRIILLDGNTTHIEVGTLRAGTSSGRDSVMICLPPPDGRVVLAETTADLFTTAGRAITGWQEGRRDRGEG